MRPAPDVLCIIQARLKSTRLPNKMLQTLGGETLIARGHRLACDAFSSSHVVVAIPASDMNSPLGEELQRIGAEVFAWDCHEDDVLARFYACAHRYRWHPESVIFRWTPDDWNKNPAICRVVAGGERWPVELGGEAFTLAMLDKATDRIPSRVWENQSLVPDARQHITRALFAIDPPEAPKGHWTIDTPEDLAAAREILER